MLYIGASGGIVYVMRKKHPWNSTYETPTKEVDKFPHWQYAVRAACGVCSVACVCMFVQRVVCALLRACVCVQRVLCGLSCAVWLGVDPKCMFPI